MILTHTLNLTREYLILVEHLLLCVAQLVHCQGVLLAIVKYGFFNSVHVTFFFYLWTAIICAVTMYILPVTLIICLMFIHMIYLDFIGTQHYLFMFQSFFSFFLAYIKYSGTG